MEIITDNTEELETVEEPNELEELSEEVSPSEEKILVSEFSALSGKEDFSFEYSISVFELDRPKRGGKPAEKFKSEYYCEIPTLSDIQERHGGGEYRLKLSYKVEGKAIVKTNDVLIADPDDKAKLEREKQLHSKIAELEKQLHSSKSESSARDNMEMLKIILQQSENSKNEMREMFLLMQQNQNQLMQSFLSQIRQIPAQQNDMKVFLQGLELGRDLGFGEGESEGKDNNPLWSALGEALSGFLGAGKEEGEPSAERVKPESLREYEESET